MNDFKEKYKNCTDCDLCQTRTQVVFGSGKEDSPKILLVGEAPGDTEDKSGKPFVGLAGDKLNRILEYIGLNRCEVYITNSVLCRPPDNRNPKMEEVQACNDRLHDEIDLVRPELIIALGKYAYQALTKTDIGSTPLREYFSTSLSDIDIRGKTYKFLTTYHPAYLVRSGISGTKKVVPHWNLVKEYLQGGNYVANP